MSGSDLFTGTLEILILKTLLGGSLHGYGIGRRLRNRSDGVLSVREGALYPALQRLQKSGFIKGTWGKNDTGRRAKFYKLTTGGHEFLASETRRWEQFSGAVADVLSEAR
jgi:PadR family transcriptional regulator PadR